MITRICTGHTYKRAGQRRLPSKFPRSMFCDGSRPVRNVNNLVVFVVGRLAFCIRGLGVGGDSGLTREGRTGLFKFIFSMLEGRNSRPLLRRELETFVRRLRPDLTEVYSRSAQDRAVVSGSFLRFVRFVRFFLSTTCRAISHPSGSCVGSFARIGFYAVTARQFFVGFFSESRLTLFCFLFPEGKSKSTIRRSLNILSL